MVRTEPPVAQRKITRQSKIAIVGAGLSGAAVARTLSEQGFTNLSVFEALPHVAGNAYTERCPTTGVMLHKYGPHIFHTDDDAVWHWMDRFAKFQPFIQRTKAIGADGRVYSFPINLHTINQFFGEQYTPEQAQHRIAVASALTTQGPDPLEWMGQNFENHALGLIGRKLYTNFIDGYTRKAWGREPDALPASIIKRLPLRFTYDDNVFFHKYQGMPRQGYTVAVERMLDHIKVRRREKFDRRHRNAFDHVFYTGPLDEWFGYQFGKLAYRTLDFDHRTTMKIDFAQGCSVLNNCDPNVPWTRRTEHKLFAPWEPSTGTVITTETPREWVEGDVRYYPVRLAEDKAILGKYLDLAKAEPEVTFVGRLATYRYLDMDQCLREAIDAARVFAGRAGARDVSSF